MGGSSDREGGTSLTRPEVLTEPQQQEEKRENVRVCVRVCAKKRASSEACRVAFCVPHTHTHPNQTAQSTLARARIQDARPLTHTLEFFEKGQRSPSGCLPSLPSLPSESLPPNSLKPQPPPPPSFPRPLSFLPQNITTQRHLPPPQHHQTSAPQQTLSSLNTATSSPTQVEYIPPHNVTRKEVGRQVLTIQQQK